MNEPPAPAARPATPLSLDDFVLAGTLITRRDTCPPDRSPELIPRGLVSLSSCLRQHLPSGDDAGYTLVLADWGVDAARAREAAAWAEARRRDEDFPWNAWDEIDTPRAFVRLFLHDVADVQLIAVGVHKDQLERFLESTQPPSGSRWARGSPALIASRRRSLPPGGRPLGIEVVTDAGCYGSFSCSWICNGLERELAKEGPRPNAHGLLDDHDVALAFAERINRGEIGGEPGVWRPWLLVDYPLEAS